MIMKLKLLPCLYAILGIFFVFLIFSCTNEDDLEINSSKTIINKLKNDLKLDQFTNQNIADNLVVNWENTKKIEKENFIIFEIEVNEKNPSKLQSNLFQKELKYELIAIKKDNIIYSYLVEVYTKKNYEIFTNTIQKLKNFTGTLNVYELGGKEIEQLVVFSGKVKNPSNKHYLQPLNDAINLFYHPNEIINSRLPVCNQVVSVRVTEEVYIDHFNVWTTTTGLYIGTYLTSTTLVSTRSYYASYPYDCGSSGDYNSIVYRIPSYEHNSEIIPMNEAEFKSKINSATPNAWDFEFVTNQNTVTAKATFLFLPWAGVKILVNQNASKIFTIQNVSSDAFGLTLGYTWNQNTYNQSTVGNITTINVYGNLNYTMFAQGIGNVYSSPIIFQININNTNGHIISGKRLP